jgi:hypothetical protein
MQQADGSPTAGFIWRYGPNEWERLSLKTLLGTDSRLRSARPLIHQRSMDGISPTFTCTIAIVGVAESATGSLPAISVNRSSVSRADIAASNQPGNQITRPDLVFRHT